MASSRTSQNLSRSTRTAMASSRTSQNPMRKGSDSKLRFLSLTAIWSDAILQSGKVPKGWDKLVVSVVSVETDLSSSPISDLRSPKPNFSSSVKCLYPLKYPSFPILLCVKDDQIPIERSNGREFKLSASHVTVGLIYIGNSTIADSPRNAYKYS
uniref:Uncharacterized protein n=1 Tax=Cannabis sativa TaxID=3483 RepID=A0A803Q3B0_CANSA